MAGNLLIGYVRVFLLAAAGPFWPWHPWRPISDCRKRRPQDRRHQYAKEVDALAERLAKECERYHLSRKADPECGRC
jgi:hypothetical protein